MGSPVRWNTKEKLLFIRQQLGHFEWMAGPRRDGRGGELASGGCQQELARDLLDPVMPGVPSQEFLMLLVSTAEGQHVEGGQGPASSESTGGWLSPETVRFCLGKDR